MLLGNGQGEIAQRQRHEQVRLHHGYPDVQTEEDKGKRDRNQREKRQGDQSAGKDVGKETNGEREHAGEVGDNLDHKHQRGEPPHRPKKLLDVSPAVLADAVIVVVEKGKERAAKRNNHIRGGRLQPRNQPQQVAEQDEQAQNGDEAEEALEVVTDDGFALLGDKLMDSFRDVLQRIGFFDIERQANRDKENQEDRDDQQFHRKRVVDRSEEHTSELQSPMY